jgi:hypothetical protein
LKIKSDNRIDKTSVKQTVSLFEQADSLFYVWSDYLIKNHQRADASERSQAANFKNFE